MATTGRANSGTTLLVWLVPACLCAMGVRWFKRESHASAPATPMAQQEEYRALPSTDLVASTPTALVSPAELPSNSAFVYAFLPADLQGLGELLPGRLKAFDAAAPADRLFIGRELLTQSIGVIMCATGAGPVPAGTFGDGDLSFVGQDGKWSFQLNRSTFHFTEYEFPEYPQFIDVLSSAYDEDMETLAPVELPDSIADNIRQRALEALAWL